MLCVQMLRLTRYMPMPWMRMALQAARASQSSPMPNMITSGAALPRDLRSAGKRCVKSKRQITFVALVVVGHA